MCAWFFSRYLIYTTRLHKLFAVQYGGSYLNKTLFILFGIPVRQLLLLILACNLMFRSEYIILDTG
jgi:hypothetical protein